MTNITYVVDSSIYASIIVRDEHYERARNFIMSHKRSELATVATAFAEVANALWKHTYLLQRVPEKSYQILKNMVVPLIETSTGWICEPTRLLSQALDVAAKYRITVYDALFVALALRAKAKLASFDHKLREALEAKGLDIVYVP